jgi:hypothetical protein
MARYKLHCFDAAGKIESAEVLDANNDGEAVILARALNNTFSCEIWNRDRLVARLPAIQLQA